MNQIKLVDVINQLLKNNTAFVAFRQPQNDEPQLFAGGEFNCIDSLNAIPEHGFVFYPFDADNEKIRFLKPQQISTGWELQIDFSTLSSQQNKVFQAIDAPYVASKTEYIGQAESLTSKLRSGDLKKVVLSRLIAHELGEVVDWGRKFEQLCQKYPTAFVYVLSDGQGLFWSGATPETLISVSNQKAYTMALAGTQPAKLNPEEKYFWQSKEREEQQYVTDYIAGILLDLGVKKLTISETTTHLAGKLAHLVNHIDFEIPTQFSALNLAQKVHPTPAICGFPKEKAFELILKTEQHKRSFYSGFLGIIQENNAADFYVNLRCVQVVGNQLYSYVGGGLTADSNPEKEWAETVLKSQTMLSLFIK
ncbi:MAG: chorismate-binding protein [Bacteroidales bacterium]|nr:chorismate-binding protein [Bacteroidales bacterium]